MIVVARWYVIVVAVVSLLIGVVLGEVVAPYHQPQVVEVRTVEGR